MRIPGFSAETVLGPSVHHYATVLIPGWDVSEEVTPTNIFNPPPNCTPTDWKCVDDCNLVYTLKCATGGSTSDTTSCCARGATCENGNCVCSTGTVNCDGVCKNLQNDANNCGTCGNSCNGGTCNNGRCDCSSAPGLTLCGNSCVNLQTDRNNCGSCGKQCLPGVPCAGGLCNCPHGQFFGKPNSFCIPGRPWSQIEANLENLPPGLDPIDTCYCTLGPRDTGVATVTPGLCKGGNTPTGVWQLYNPSCCLPLGPCGDACCSYFPPGGGR
jgi:hypothetical protein